ncbi:MAG: hypothetical protein AAFY29_07590 [Pseudomonadota bacterium]
MANVPLPTTDDVRRMLAMMYDDLEVAEGEAVSEEGEKCVVAIYLSDDDQPIAAALSDYRFAAFTGAALTRIPPGGAEDAADEKDLGESIRENVQEVFNICSRLLMTADSPHLRLGNMYEGVDDIPDGEKAVFAATSRASFTVDVPNYGDGKVTFIGL